MIRRCDPNLAILDAEGSIKASLKSGREQVEDWRRRGVSIADACISLGRRPTDDWDHVIAIVAAEHVKALRIISARQDQARGRAA